MGTNKVTKVSDLVFDKRNANKHSEHGMAKLEKSINKIGLGRSILISDDNEIIAGNGVTESAINAGIQKVKVIETDGTEIIAVKRTDIKSGTKEFYEMALSDNIIAKENIVMDAEVTNAICEEYEIEEYKMDEGKTLEAEEDDFDVPEGGTETDIVLGDLFEIGQHRLLCGSSTETDSWNKLLGEKLVDMVVTDPPYNVDYQGGDRTEMKKLHRRTDGLKIQNDAMSDSDFYQFLYDFYTALGSYTKEGGAWYVWHADMETLNFRKAMLDAGLLVKQNLIWVKDQMVMGRQDFHWQHEPCLYGWKPGAAHNWYGDRKQVTILNFARPKVSKEHPTMKPIELIAYQIGLSSKVGDIVADGFGGSGTTMVASHQLKRNSVLCELDPKYCQVIIDRMKKLDPSLKIKKNGVLLND